MGIVNGTACYPSQRAIRSICCNTVHVQYIQKRPRKGNAQVQRKCVVCTYYHRNRSNRISSIRDTTHEPRPQLTDRVMTIEYLLHALYTKQLLRPPPISPMILCVKNTQLPPNTVQVFRYTFNYEYGHAVHTEWKATNIKPKVDSLSNPDIVFYFMWRNIHLFRGVRCLDLVIMGVNKNETVDSMQILRELHERENVRAIEHVAHDGLDGLLPNLDNGVHNPHETCHTILEFLDATVPK